MLRMTSETMPGAEHVAASAGSGTRFSVLRAGHNRASLSILGCLLLVKYILAVGRVVDVV